MENRTGAPQGRNMSRNVENLLLTEEERKVLRDCRKNSMIRGVPAGIISALITKFAINSGRFIHLAQWSRFYYAASFTGGLLLGVASYRNTCLEKIMKLENSALADQVRDYYRRAGMEYTGPQPQDKVSGFDVGGYGNLSESDFASAKESISHYPSNENKWPSPNDLRDNKPEEQRHITFEELRKQNRQKWHQEQYPPRSSQKLDSRKEDKPLKQIQQDSDQHMPVASHDRYTQGSTGVVRRNKYGDPIE